MLYMLMTKYSLQSPFFPFHCRHFSSLFLPSWAIWPLATKQYWSPTSNQTEMKTTTYNKWYRSISAILIATKHPENQLSCRLPLLVGTKTADYCQTQHNCGHKNVQSNSFVQLSSQEAKPESVSKQCWCNIIITIFWQSPVTFRKKPT